MRIIPIGDIHGRKQWSTVLELEKEADKIIFLADYHDSHFGIFPAEQIKQFDLILKAKRADPDRIVLLIGNHDFHYLSCTKPLFPYTNMDYYGEIQYNLEQAISEGLLQIAYTIQDGDTRYLFTHAGVEGYWLRKWSPLSMNKVTVDDYADLINGIFKRTPYAFNTKDSPIWTRPERLARHALPDPVTQVIGHNMTKSVKFMEGPHSIVQADVLEQYKYAVIQDNKIFSKPIPSIVLNKQPKL